MVFWTIVGVAGVLVAALVGVVSWRDRRRGRTSDGSVDRVVREIEQRYDHQRYGTAPPGWGHGP